MSRTNAAWAGMLLIAVGLAFSRSAMTAGMFVFLAVGLSAMGRAQFWRNLGQNPLLWLPLTWYGWHVISIAYTTNLEQWYYLLRIKLPYVFMPLGFAAIGVFSARQTTALLWVFVACITIVSGVTLAQYLADVDAGNARLLMSKEIRIAFGIVHVTYGLMQVLAAYACYALWRTHAARNQIAWARLAAILGVCLVACTMLFASRTGWLALLATAFLLWLRALVALPAQRLKTAAAGLVAVLLLAGATLLPSVQNKLQNSVEDVRYFMEGRRLDDWSIGKRLAAAQTAWHVGLQHPVFGVGLADLWDEMQRQYAHEPFRFDNPAERAASHNQFLEVFAGFGLIGLALFGAHLFWPLRKRRRRAQAHTGAFYGVMLAGFCTDALVEAQLGINLFLFFYFLWFVNDDTATPMDLGRMPNLQA
jgi:O-antigen ligase